MTSRQFAALLGFLFVAACLALSVGDALLCLLGAGVFALTSAFYHRELDLSDIQQRMPSRPPTSRTLR
jgi:hypothetical protein